MNARVIAAATNRDLACDGEGGEVSGRISFTVSTCFRSTSHRCAAPTAEDIPLLVWTFVRYFNEKMGKAIDTIPPRTIERLKGHSLAGAMCVNCGIMWSGR